MRIKDLKKLLTYCLSKGDARAMAAYRETIDQIMTEDHEEVRGTEVSAYPVNGTTVFVSDTGLRKPSQVIFIDLRSRKSFLQSLESFDVTT